MSGLSRDERRRVSGAAGVHYAPTRHKRVLAVVDEILNERGSTSPSVLAEIQAERERQHTIWGEQNLPDGTRKTIPTLNAREFAQRECSYAHEHDLLTWRHVLDEEVAEAFAEEDPLALRAELVQVAAVAAQWIEAIDRRGAS